jgi:hypothetical protein
VSLQIAGLLASMVVLLVVVAIGFVFQPLPQVGVTVTDQHHLQWVFYEMAKEE